MGSGKGRTKRVNAVKTTSSPTKSVNKLKKFVTKKVNPNTPLQTHEIKTRLRWITEPDYVITEFIENDNLSDAELIKKIKESLMHNLEGVIGGAWELDNQMLIAVNGHKFTGGLSLEEADSAPISRLNANSGKLEHSFLIEFDIVGETEVSDFYNSQSNLAKNGLTTNDMIFLLNDSDTEMASDYISEEAAEKSSEKLSGAPNPKIDAWDVISNTLKPENITIAVKKLNIPEPKI